MTRSRTKTRMKVIPGGKQLSLIRDTEEILKFLEFTATTGSVDPAVLERRLKACQWCFLLLKEEEDHAGWIRENLDLILSRQTEVAGLELDSLVKLISDALEDYRSWCSDPFGWERKQKNSEPNKKAAETPFIKPSGRTLTFPLKAGVCIEVRLPDGGLSTEDFVRLGLFLYPYCNDLDLTKTFSWLALTEKP